MPTLIRRPVQRWHRPRRVLLSKTGASFSATPTTIPSGHSGNIVLTLTGSGTTWAGGGSEFSVSGVANVTKVGESVTSATSATLTLTTGAGTGTLTIMDGDGLTTTVTVAASSISRSPTTIVISSTGNVIALTGTNTLWATDSPTFSLSGGTGASITAQNITTETAATVTISAGSATGTLTITDPSTGATTTVTVIDPPPGTPGDPNVRHNSAHIYLNGTTAWVTTQVGAFWEFEFDGTSLACEIDSSRYSGAASGNSPIMHASIDGGVWTTDLTVLGNGTDLSAGAKTLFRLALVTGLTNTRHTARVFFAAQDNVLDRWAAVSSFPEAALIITKFCKSDGSALTTYAPTWSWSTQAICFGDSRTQNNNYDVDGWWNAVCAGLDAAPVYVAHQGEGLHNPSPTNGAEALVNSYNLMWAGTSRPSDSTMDTVFINLGPNDGGESNATIQADMETVLAGLEALYTNAKIFAIIGPGDYFASAVTAAVAADTSGRAFLIDMDAFQPEYTSHWDGNNDPSIWSLDGLHMNAAGEIAIGGMVLRLAIQAAPSIAGISSGSGAGGSRRRPQ